MFQIRRNSKRKGAAFARCAFYFYLAAMRVDDCLYIAKAKAKSFHVMQVAGMGAVEFFKYPRLGFLIHPYAVVFYPHGEHPIPMLQCFHCDMGGCR